MNSNDKITLIIVNIRPYSIFHSFATSDSDYLSSFTSPSSTRGISYYVTVSPPIASLTNCSTLIFDPSGCLRDSK